MTSIQFDPGWLERPNHIGGYVAIDDYTRSLLQASVELLASPANLVYEEIIQLHQKAVDEARAAAQ